jgi:CRP-like cAMP-binding protein
MKTLFEDDLKEAGYDLPTSGLCYNLDPEDSKALISEGEWLLAEDELVAREGESQQFLYMVVSGSVELSKKDDKGKQQVIANLGTGETFGEVAFLRGHIASATSETRGLCILWRMNHDQLLEFIGSHGTIAGQLCLNLAGLLADRLLKENTVVSKVKMDLEEAISSLRVASEEDNLKTSALKELQNKVEILNHATRVRKQRVSKRSKFNSISMSSIAVASLAVIGMIGLYNSYDHEAPQMVVALNEKIETMQKNESFYLDLKKRLEAENEELIVENSNLKVLSDSISGELQDTKEQLSYRDYEYDSLKAKFLETEEELAALISLEQEAQSEDLLVDANPSDLYVPLIPQEFIDQIKEWAYQYSTLAFPCEVKVMDEPVTLSDLELKANVEIQVGEILVVTRFHPVSEEYVVARQGDSDTFMASVHVNNTDILEVLAEKFVNHMKDMGKKVSNPFMSNRFSQIDKNFSEEN